MLRGGEMNYFKSPCECGIESPGSINHRVSWLVCLILVIKESIKILVLCTRMPLLFGFVVFEAGTKSLRYGSFSEQVFHCVAHLTQSGRLILEDKDRQIM